MRAAVDGIGYRRGQVDDPIDEFGLLDLRQRGVTPVEFLDGQPIPGMKRRNRLTAGRTIRGSGRIAKGNHHHLLLSVHPVLVPPRRDHPISV